MPWPPVSPLYPGYFSPLYPGFAPLPGLLSRPLVPAAVHGLLAAAAVPGLLFRRCTRATFLRAIRNFSPLYPGYSPAPSSPPLYTGYSPPRRLAAVPGLLFYAPFATFKSVLRMALHEHEHEISPSRERTILHV
jgi:hypothetical protein